MYTLQVQNEEVDLSLGVEDLGIDSDLSGALRNPDNVTSWPTMSSDSFGKTHSLTAAGISSSETVICRTLR